MRCALAVSVCNAFSASSHDYYGNCIRTRCVCWMRLDMKCGTSDGVRLQVIGVMCGDGRVCLKIVDLTECIPSFIYYFNRFVNLISSHVHEPK